MKSSRSIAVFACASAGVVGAIAGPPDPVATVQELMVAHIDPAADALWDSVAFITSAKGEEDRRPRTPQQWAAVRQSAMALIKGASDLQVAGRRVSAAEATPGPGELRASEIQHLIETDPTAFTKRARGLNAAARMALAAIDAKDAEALMNAGGVIDSACEACHMVYWYPSQLKGGR